MSTKEKTAAVMGVIGTIILVGIIFYSINEVFENDTKRRRNACEQLAKKLEATEWKTGANGSDCRMVVNGELVEAGNL